MADGRMEEDQLRNLILTMCDEPVAILIKLADRLHNMRTVWALKSNKVPPTPQLPALTEICLELGM